MPTVIVTEDNFRSVISSSEIPVLVDFWAGWCEPCRRVAPVLEEMSEELSGKIRFARINVNDEPDLAYRYRICSVPTMLLFRGGRVTDSFSGAMSKQQLISLLDSSAAQ